MFQITTALRKIKALKSRLKIIQGGSSAGKTVGILSVMIDRLQREPNKLSSVVSATMPHLKRGAIRDFINIMETQGYYKDDRWNRTDFIYTFETGSKLEFFSADQSDKVRGPRRNGDLFINEANNIGYETFTQLDIRTEGDIFIDYNPTGDFWAQDEIITPNVEHDFVKLTYMDNEGLSPTIIQTLERRRKNASWWRVFGEGEMGLLEGVIYPNWKQIDEMPMEARLLRRWLDYGYTNDPTAVGEIWKWNDSYVLNENLYQTGLLNNQIAEVILNLDGSVPVAADSAEPKSNDELALRGITIIPARKGKDSVNSGIQLVQQENVFVTRRSVNIWKERCNYIWMVDDKTNKALNEPTPIFNHHMDGIRYGFESLLGSVPEKVLEEQREKMDINYHRRIMNQTK